MKHAFLYLFLKFDCIKTLHLYSIVELNGFWSSRFVCEVSACKL